MKTSTLILAACLASAEVGAIPVFGAMENLGPRLNSDSKDGDAWETPDGLELYFFSSREGGIGLDDLWVSRRKSRDAAWEEPTNLGEPVNTQLFEWGPSLSPDGLALYFASNRQGGCGGYDLWYSKRDSKDSPWTGPANFGSPPNDQFDVDKPSVASDGLELIFSDGNAPPYRPGGYGRADLWVSSRASPSGPWSAPKNLGPIVNTEHAEYSSFLSPDGLTLFFASDRPGGMGGMDIWVTTRDRREDEWGEAKNLGSSVNSAHWELRPFLSADEKYLYFCSLRPGMGLVDMWRVPIVSKEAFSQEYRSR